MKTKLLAATVLGLFIAQAAATVGKTADNITVLGDASEFSSGALGQAGGIFTLDGALGGVAYSSPSAGVISLESGFYSRMVGSPIVDYSNANVSGYALSLGQTNPPGTTYDIFVSTWAGVEPYMVFYSTDETGRPVESLTPNASFYNFVLANYMEGDYSPFASTTVVTLAAAVSSGSFHFDDVGHNTLNLSFSVFDNPPPVSGSAWENAPLTMPAPRYGQASAVYGSQLFVSGGYDGVYFSSAVYRAGLNAAGLAPWQTAGYMPEALYAHQLVAARGRLYVLGGYNSLGTRSAVWSADISSAGILGAWEHEANLPSVLYFHAAALAGNKLYVSGGYTSGFGVSAAVYKTELGDDGTLGPWGTATNLPAPRYAHTMTFLANRFYVAGGKDGASAKSEVWVAALDASGEISGSWASYASLPAPRYGHKTLTAANVLYVIGGNSGGAAQNAVFFSTVSANPAASAPWFAYTPLNSSRQFQTAEIFSDRLYVFGGSDGSHAKDDIFVSILSGTGYLVEISPDTNFAVGRKDSGWMSGYNWSFAELEPGVTYYLRARARNRLFVETSYSAAGSALTYAALPGTAPWTNVGIIGASANWLSGGNQPGSAYELLYSSYPDYSIAHSSATTQLSAFLTDLQANTTFYAKVRVLNEAGRASRFIALPSLMTVFDPALDTSSPTITDNQADDALWRRAAAFAYDVDFFDNGAGDSGLSGFQVQAATKAGGASGIVAPWSDAVTGINAPAYAQNWVIPQAVWTNMYEGLNYISVRAIDNVGQSSTSIDVFSVLKDTTPPFITVSYSTPAVWYSQYPGDVDGLRFDDAFSGLNRVQYSISANKNFGDGAVKGWTDLTGLTSGSTYYEPVISYDFARLVNSTSNYFSLRAVDVAGSTRTLVDAFAIIKNVSGPMVVITAPASDLAYLSTLTYVSGNTSETNSHAVLGTEVAVRDRSTGFYWNGTSFLAASHFWYDASDLSGAFTFAFANLVLADGIQYEVIARSSDSAGDYSQLFATYTFIYDSQPPEARVISPADGSAAYSISSISGTSADAASGVSLDEAVLRRVSDGLWWNNSQSLWTANQTSLPAGTTAYWTWNFNDILRDSLTHGTAYYADIRASDKSFPANAGAFGIYGSTFTYYDNTPPPATLNLAAVVSNLPGAVVLFWTSAGDNGPVGYLLSGTYKIAHSTFTGAAVSTTSAQVEITTAAVTAGSTRYLVVSGLTASSSHYFTIWTADDAHNWSGASNEAVAMAGSSNYGGISGLIKDGAGYPITGVLLEAFAPNGALEGSDFTDTSGIYSISDLGSANFTVKATWAADDIESSVSKDGIANGSEGVNFGLSITYMLASISGFIPEHFLPASHPKLSAAYTTREVRPAQNMPFVEIYRKGRRIGAAFADQHGAFKVPNLLPGTYSIRVYNGSDFSKMEVVSLKAGQNFMFSPKFELLNKDKVYAYPNPAGKIVNFHFYTSLAAGAFEAVVEVFDISGRLIKTLDSYSADSVVGDSGHGYVITWNMSGEKMASGVYVYILRVKNMSGGAEKVIKKFAVIR